MLLVRVHSRSYSRSVAHPKIPITIHDMTRTSKYHSKRAYFGTSTALPYQYVVYGTVRTHIIRTRYILRFFVTHDTGSVSRSLAGVRVPVSQNEDSLCTSSVRECNTSNTASTPNISGVCTAAAVDTACARGSVLLITYWHTSMSTYKGTVRLSRRTHRYSDEARMNVLSVEQYHTTYCRPG